MSRIKKAPLPPTDIEHSQAGGDDIVFSFKYLHEHSFTDKRVKSNFLQGFLLRLKKLSELGWQRIRQEKRHGYGCEKIHISQIKADVQSTPTPDTNYLLAFRSSGDNKAFLGVQTGKTFHILFIEARHGDIYEH